MAVSPLPRHAPVPVRDTDIGPQRLCRGCVQQGEPDPWWPVDVNPPAGNTSDDFWFYVDGRPAGRCKACWSERTRVNGRRLFRPLVAL